MNISKRNAERMQELVQEMMDRLEEFKRLAKEAMTSSEYQQFKYRTLGHLEPALMEESEWYVGRTSSLDSLQKIAQEAEDEAGENPMCKKCGSPLDEEEFCTKEDCFYHEWDQSEEEEKPGN